MLNKLKHFKFQGLVMEISLVVFNVFLVLTLVYAWSHYFGQTNGNNNGAQEINFVKAEHDTTIVE
ncbi:MAG: hypothetical protein ACPGLV_11100 [Bacteroidia bacterium]